MYNEHYTIKELEKLSGIKAHTIRMWEKRYGILQPERTETNIRHYKSDDLKKLMNLSFLNKNGFKISYLSELSEEELKQKTISLTYKNTDAQRQIEALIALTMEIDSLKLEKLLTSLFLNRGFEDFYAKIIVPFLTKIYFLWQTEVIDAAHKYFAENIIRQKIIVAIDSILPHYNPNKKYFLLILPEHENHEISLLYAYYKLKQKNHKVSYFGGVFCMKNMPQIEKINQAEFVLTTFSPTYPSEQIPLFIEKLSHVFENKTIIVFDENANKKDKKKYNKALLINDLNSL